MYIIHVFVNSFYESLKLGSSLYTSVSLAGHREVYISDKNYVIMITGQGRYKSVFRYFNFLKRKTTISGNSSCSKMAQ